MAKISTPMGMAISENTTASMFAATPLRCRNHMEGGYGGLVFTAVVIIITGALPNLEIQIITQISF